MGNLFDHDKIRDPNFKGLLVIGQDPIPIFLLVDKSNFPAIFFLRCLAYFGIYPKLPP